MQVGIQPVSIGFVLAAIALIIIVALLVTGQLPFLWLGVILLTLAVSRLV